MWYSLSGYLNTVAVGDTIHWLLHQMSVEPKTPIKLYLSLDGGENAASIRLYDFLKGVPNPLETVAFGHMRTPALLPYLAGDRRISLPRCTFELSASFYKTEPEDVPLKIHEEAVRGYKREEERMLQIIATETNQDITKINELWQKGTFLSSEQAKELGIVHILTENMPLTTPNPSVKDHEEEIKN